MCLHAMQLSQLRRWCVARTTTEPGHRPGCLDFLRPAVDLKFAVHSGRDRNQLPHTPPLCAGTAQAAHGIVGSLALRRHSRPRTAVEAAIARLLAPTPHYTAAAKSCEGSSAALINQPDASSPPPYAAMATTPRRSPATTTSPRDARSSSRRSSSGRTRGSGESPAQSVRTRLPGAGAAPRFKPGEDASGVSTRRVSLMYDVVSGVCRWCWPVLAWPVWVGAWSTVDLVRCPCRVGCCQCPMKPPQQELSTC